MGLRIRLLILLGSLGTLGMVVPGCGPTSRTSRPGVAGAVTQAARDAAAVPSAKGLIETLREVGVVYWRHESSCIAWQVEGGDSTDAVVLARAWSDEEGRKSVKHTVATANGQVYLYAALRRVESGQLADRSWRATTRYSYCVEILPLKALTADHAQVGPHEWYFSRDACQRARSDKTGSCGARVR